MRCVQVRNDEEEWDRIRTNHDELLLGNTHLFLRELFLPASKIGPIGGKWAKAIFEKSNKAEICSLHLKRNFQLTCGPECNQKKNQL